MSQQKVNFKIVEEEDADRVNFRLLQSPAASSKRADRGGLSDQALRFRYGSATSPRQNALTTGH